MSRCKCKKKKPKTIAAGLSRLNGKKDWYRRRWILETYTNVRGRWYLCHNVGLGYRRFPVKTREPRQGLGRSPLAAVRAACQQAEV